MNTERSKRALRSTVIVGALLMSGCASKSVILPPASPPPAPTVSVDMPRKPTEILEDASATLSDLRQRQQAARLLLTP